MNRARLLAIAPLFLAIALTALLALQPSGIFGTYDYERMHEPYREDFRQAVLAGEWPWWNPYTALGRPFFADIETATLYPSTWLALIFGVKIGVLLTIALHFAAAMYGTQQLAERLGVRRPMAIAAGVSFALSGALFARIQAGQIQFFCVVCLWPYIWATALRLQDEHEFRALLGAVAALALGFLAGSPQILWCGLIAMIPLLLLRCATWKVAAQTSLWMAAAGVLALGLVAVQLLPFIELVQQGNRPLSDPGFAARHGEQGLSWLSVVLPPGPWLPVNWEWNLGVGLIALLGAVVAVVKNRRDRNVRALAGVVTFMAVLALGDASPVLPALAEWLPGFSSVRYPSRYGLAAVLAVVVLFHLWLDRAVIGNRGRIAWWFFATNVALSIFGVFSQGMLYRSLPTPRHEENIRADLAEARLPADGAPPRALLPESLLRANGGASAGVSTIAGFNNPALNRTWTSLYVLAGETPPDFHRTNVVDAVQGKLWDHRAFYGVSVDTAPPKYEVNFHPPAAPRAYLAYAAEVVPDWHVALEKVRAGHDFLRAPLLEKAVGDISDQPIPPRAAEIIAFRRNSVTIEYSSPSTAMLVLAEPWYPGWTARVDDYQLPVVPVNGWMRGVQVPAGKHRVKFRFVGVDAAAVAISIGSTLLVAGLAWTGRRKKENRGEGTSAPSSMGAS